MAIKIKKRITVLILSLVIALALPVHVLAAGNINTEQEVQLTISYRSGNTLLSGAAFDIYQVATVNEIGELTSIFPFNQFNVDIRGKNDEAWKAVASTLEGYVLRDNITPTSSGKTDAKGVLKFTNQVKQLKQGLYLVLGHRHIQDERIYDAAPFMIMLPTQDIDTNVWLYDVTANPKCDSWPEPSEPNNNTVTRKVLKVWADSGYEKNRPKEVIVQLLKNGTIYDTVSLSADNDWRYTWEKLDDNNTWTIAEKEMDDYSVTVTEEGITFVVTNTYTGNSTQKLIVPQTPGNASLPQTGQLWWPVPILIAVGLLLIIIGLLRRRGSSDEK